jgi:hypothetical protein
MFGETEFQVRDIVHGIGAKAIEVALDSKKRNRTKVRPAIVPPVPARPSFNAGNFVPS